MDNKEPDPIKIFIAQINQREARYKGDPLNKHVHHWLLPKELLLAVRDKLQTELPLFDTK